MIDASHERPAEPIRNHHRAHDERNAQEPEQRPPPEHAIGQLRVRHEDAYDCERSVRTQDWLVEEDPAGHALLERLWSTGPGQRLGVRERVRFQDFAGPQHGAIGEHGGNDPG